MSEETSTATVASAFAGAKEKAAAKALPGGPFVSGEERQAWYLDRRAFWIVAAMPVESKDYGSRSRFIIVFDPSHIEFTQENSRTLDLSYTPLRDALIEELQPILQATKIVGPVYLRKVDTTKGNPAWDLSDEPPPSDEIPY